MMKRLVPVLVAIAAFYLYQAFVEPGDWQNTRSAPVPAGNAETAAGYRDGQQARGAGTVVRILPDDNDGSRHQRFIIRLDGGRTLLIAHNIDLAPRVSGIREGDTVEFYGEFAVNDKGGVIHWTHHDPQGRHPDGWLRHRGRTYQ
jgi:hypothetical protein